MRTQVHPLDLCAVTQNFNISTTIVSLFDT